MIKQYLSQFIDVLFTLMDFAIFARILLSWFPANSGGQIRTFLIQLTEPVLAPFRRIIPRIGMMDISPIVALFILDFVKTILMSLLA